jgi:hypothetical protein
VRVLFRGGRRDWEADVAAVVTFVELEAEGEGVEGDVLVDILNGRLLTCALPLLLFFFPFFFFFFL